MTALSRRTRLLAPPVALILAAGALASVSAPASAANSTFTQDTDIFMDDSSFETSNTGLIDLPDGQASPYPSTINVTHNAVITDLEVSFVDMNHVFPDDVDIMLVGPHGQQVTLMSDAGGTGDLVDVDLTFDDAAAAPLPDAAQITAGTYQPSNFGDVNDAFDAPAPASTGGTSLAVFNGTLAAGVWSLFATDDLGAFVGNIEGGWFISFTFATTPYPSVNTVSGLPPITDVNVRVDDVTTTHPDDVNLLLVGPGGQSAFLMGDAGGSGDLTDVDLTFDDEAAAPLPNETALTSGSYQPVSYGPNTFPAPAPATGTSVLNVFDGLSPNGEWRLYADDDSGDDVTVIRSWSLVFTWADTQIPTGSVIVNGGAAKTGTKNVTLTLSATDPAPASGVTEMRFSNDGVSFSPYRPFAATAAWTLSGGEGKKTVYAQFRDGDGNVSAVVSDAITYGVGPRAKSVSPKKNAKGVSRSVTVTIKANEKLNKNTVNGKKVFLKRQGSSAKVPATVSYVKGTKTIVLNPNGNLAPGAKYTVTVKGVKDAKGNKWDEKPKRSGAQPLKYSFTT